MSEYEPELGQAIFGQPYQEYGVPDIWDSALCFIRDRLDTVMWNKHQKEYDSPFGNTANSFKCDVFEVEAYSWNDNYDQPYNFKWRDVEISWYKYLGRGMSANQELTPDRASEMLVECLARLQKVDQEAWDEIVHEGQTQ